MEIDEISKKIQSSSILELELVWLPKIMGNQLDTINDDLYREVKAIRQVRENIPKLKNEQKDLVKLMDLAYFCKYYSVLGWCTEHKVKRNKPECKVCLNNT